MNEKKQPGTLQNATPTGVTNAGKPIRLHYRTGRGTLYTLIVFPNGVVRMRNQNRLSHCLSCVMFLRTDVPGYEDARNMLRKALAATPFAPAALLRAARRETRLDWQLA